jgi:hypothetical protein
MLTAADAARTDILAKDGNRPFLMLRAFAEDAELQIIQKTDAIAFPNQTKGREAIENVLVRRFNLDYENVFTLLPDRATGDPAGAFRLRLAGRDVGQGERGAARRLRPLRLVF